MGDVVNFPRFDEFNDFLARLREAYREDKITDFICIVRSKGKDEENARLGSKWFGDESCLYLRGMLKRMDDRIREYMDENEINYGLEL